MLMYPQWRFTAGVEAGPFLPACRGPQWAPPGPHCFATGPSGLRGQGMVPPPYMSPQSDEDSRHSSASPCSLEGCGGASGAASGALACRWRECSRAFVTLEGLSQHVSAQHATSGRAGLFYCEWQGCARSHRGFNARYKMLVHVRTHTNEKPHQCGQCDKSFSRAENLKIHIRSHSGEKPYVCTVEGCTKAYSNSSDRFKHTRTHSVDKPYGCKVPGCEKRYTDPSSLRKHVKTYKHFSAHITVSTHPMEPNHQPYTAYHRMEERVPPVYFEMAPKQPTVEYIPPIDTYLSCESEIIQRNYDIDRYRSISYSEGSIRSVPEFRVSPKVAVDYPVSNSCPQLSTAGYCQTEDGRLSAVSVRSERTHLPDDKCTNLECEVFPRKLTAEETPLNLKRRSTSESAVELYENGVLNLEKKPRLSLDICDIPLDLSTKN